MPSFRADFASADRLRDRGQAVDQDDDRTLIDLMVEQIEFADVILLNKVDLVDAETLNRIMAGLKRLMGALNWCKHALDKWTEFGDGCAAIRY